jgi:hypothetical protein
MAADQSEELGGIGRLAWRVRGFERQVLKLILSSFVFSA